VVDDGRADAVLEALIRVSRQASTAEAEEKAQAADPA
jgi:hypothetical protein